MAKFAVITALLVLVKHVFFQLWKSASVEIRRSSRPMINHIHRTLSGTEPSNLNYTKRKIHFRWQISRQKQFLLITTRDSSKKKLEGSNRGRTSCRHFLQNPTRIFLFYEFFHRFHQLDFFVGHLYKAPKIIQTKLITITRQQYSTISLKWRIHTYNTVLLQLNHHKQPLLPCVRVTLPHQTTTIQLVGRVKIFKAS